MAQAKKQATGQTPTNHSLKVAPSWLDKVSTIFAKTGLTSSSVRVLSAD
jgi:hypothetical protein